MGDRPTPKFVKIETSSGDQYWEVAEPPPGFPPNYFEWTGSSQTSSHVHPEENMSIHGGPFPQMTRAPGSSRSYSDIHRNAGLLSCNPFYQPAGGIFHLFPHKDSHCPSLSILSMPPVSRGRPSYMQNSPGNIPQISYSDRVSTRRYAVGSSSNRPLTAAPRQGKQNAASYHTPRRSPPRSNNLSIGREGTSRNVSSRASGVDLEPNNLARNYTSLSTSLHHSFPNHSSGQARLMDHLASFCSDQLTSEALADQDTCSILYQWLDALESISYGSGLSDDLISKCLTESIYRYQPQDDRNCAICLEKYKDMDDVGALKCGHDFHVGCIKKSLSMKNVCPICKAAAMDVDNSNNRN